MNKYILLIGPSGSGKSTVAKELAAKYDAIIVNRDGIRSMLFGLTDDDHSFYYMQNNLYAREKLVTKIQNNAIYMALEQGYTVIVDNTNLKETYINKLEEIGEIFDIKPSLIFVDAPLEVCIDRDKSRARVVGEEIIRKQYQQYLDLKERLTSESYGKLGKDLDKKTTASIKIEKQ